MQKQCHANSTPLPGGQKPARAEARTRFPDDRPLGFAQAAGECINGALLRCEERYPRDGSHPVIYMVVERDSQQWREQLGALHRDFFGTDQSNPPSPVRLEVIDRATDDALRRLIDSGVLSTTTRATRALWPEAGAACPPPLSLDEREKALSFRTAAARKLRMAKVLAGAELKEEARQALMEAIEPLGCALAVECRLAEPQCLEDSLLQPFAAAWKEALPLVRNFLRDPSQPVLSVLSALDAV
jgi:hypothetical protein